MKPAVLVMARYWARGPVKTRLAVEVGRERARTLYRDLAARIWAGLKDERLERHLFVAAPEHLEETARWLPGAGRVEAQGEGDLGARMAGAFASAFRRGAPWCAVVGTDAPEIDAERVLVAGAALEEADAVVVPALDGGYALLALATEHPALLRDVPWGTDEVLRRTRERAEEEGLTLVLLEPVRDVDTLADYEALRKRGVL